MFNKLEETKKRYEFLTDEIVKPEVIANQNEWKKLVKERADIEEIVNKYAEYKEAEKNFEDCKAMMSDDDADIRELAKEEYDSFKTALDNVTEELKVLLIPKDPNDDKKRRHRNPRRRGRRRSRAFWCGTYAYVYALRRRETLESRGNIVKYDRTRRRKRSRVHGVWERRLQ